MPPQIEEDVNPSTATAASSSVMLPPPDIVIDDDPDETLTDDDEENPLLRSASAEDIEGLGRRRRRKSLPVEMGRRVGVGVVREGGWGGGLGGG
ncbi:hypothetical protein HDV00_004783 [Rhizophlyctis rosea]|nr:hypothetical protein HDV00_004783 [Rhizophlyctis rosea]